MRFHATGCKDYSHNLNNEISNCQWKYWEQFTHPVLTGIMFKERDEMRKSCLISSRFITKYPSFPDSDRKYSIGEEWEEFGSSRAECSFPEASGRGEEIVMLPLQQRAEVSSLACWDGSTSWSSQILLSGEGRWHKKHKKTPGNAFPECLSLCQCWKGVSSPLAVWSKADILSFAKEMPFAHFDPVISSKL